MPKESGIGLVCSIDNSAGVAKDISNDIGQVQINTSQGLQDITGLDKAAIERLGLLKDAELQFNGFFNPAADRQHAVLKDYWVIFAGQVGRTVSLVISGQTLAMEMVFENYNLTRAQDGSFVWTATARLSNGTVPAWS